MLEEGDQDDPVVDPGDASEVRSRERGRNPPDVRSQVNFEHLEESEISDRVA